MSMDFEAIRTAVASHAMASGHFDKVDSHEPKNAPGNFIRCALWMDYIGPARSSGLASTSARLVLMVRIYANMMAEPQDGIDPAAMAACHALMTAYSGDFQLGGTVMDIDLLGRSGEPMAARAGYVEQDNKMFRCLTITLPILIEDVWQQAP